VSPEFSTTQWSQVLTARDATGTEADRALAELCECYWYPLYAYVRRQGHSADEARDLTQAYFASLLEKDYLKDVEPSKGSFRNFLLTSLRNFLSHEWEKARTLKRGGGTQTISLDYEAAETRYDLEPADTTTPEQVFERRWTLMVLERALERLREWAAANGSEEQLQHLEPVLTGERPQAPYRKVAEDLGMSEGAVKAAVHRLRQRFGALLREEIAATVSDPAEIDGEVRHLLLSIRPWEPQGT
jgi:RNA polymerase sigma-70 factor (ECF subfamily)